MTLYTPELAQLDFLFAGNIISHLFPNYTNLKRRASQINDSVTITRSTINTCPHKRTIKPSKNTHIRYVRSIIIQIFSIKSTNLCIGRRWSSFVFPHYCCVAIAAHSCNYYYCLQLINFCFFVEVHVFAIGSAFLRAVVVVVVRCRSVCVFWCFCLVMVVFWWPKKNR